MANGKIAGHIIALAKPIAATKPTETYPRVSKSANTQDNTQRCRQRKIRLLRNEPGRQCNAQQISCKHGKERCRGKETRLAEWQAEAFAIKADGIACHDFDADVEK